MMMEFKIENIYEKGMKKLNEDSFLIKDNILGVFDGASDLAKFYYLISQLNLIMNHYFLKKHLLQF